MVVELYLKLPNLFSDVLHFTLQSRQNTYTNNYPIPHFQVHLFVTTSAGVST